MPKIKNLIIESKKTRSQQRHPALRVSPYIDPLTIKDKPATRNNLSAPPPPRSERLLRGAPLEEAHLRRPRLDEEQVPRPEHRRAQRRQGLGQRALLQRGVRPDLSQRLRPVDPHGPVDRARRRDQHHLRPDGLPGDRGVSHQAVLRRQEEQDHLPGDRAAGQEAVLGGQRGLERSDGGQVGRWGRFSDGF